MTELAPIKPDSSPARTSTTVVSKRAVVAQKVSRAAKPAEERRQGKAVDCGESARRDPMRAAA